MTNPNEIIKDVQIKGRDGKVKAFLRFDPATKQVKMDAVDIESLTLRDFTRIHSFWRRVQGLRYNILQTPEPVRNDPEAVQRALEILQRRPKDEEDDNFSGVMAKHFRKED